jgi:hypothetical protein
MRYNYSLYYILIYILAYTEHREIDENKLTDIIKHDMFSAWHAANILLHTTIKHNQYMYLLTLTDWRADTATYRAALAAKNMLRLHLQQVGNIYNLT